MTRYNDYRVRETIEPALDAFEEAVKAERGVSNKWVALASLLRVIGALLIEIATYSPIPAVKGDEGDKPED